MTIPAGARLGAYEVLAPLGAGGMGEVYRAKDSRLGREVALKVLPASVASDRDRLSRFEQEARAASALNHPNIVTIHEIGREGDTAYIAMELVDGKTLRELTVSGPMPVRKILGIAAQIAEGLAKAHGAGIVHRDLKPENVMISKDGFVKILDFGLAKLTDPEPGEASAMPTLAQPETRPGTVMGTVGYMSPEQASGERLDFRSDQFSLGSMLYEMATGQKAFGRKTAAETMSAIIRDEPEPRFEAASRLPGGGALDPGPLPRQGSGGALRVDARSRAGSGGIAGSHLGGLQRSRGAARLAAVRAALRLRVDRRGARSGGRCRCRGLGWLRDPSRREAASAPSFKRLSFSAWRHRECPLCARRTNDRLRLSAVRRSREMVLSLTRLDSAESKPFEFPGDILSISKSGELAIWQPTQPAAALGTLAVVPMTGGAPRPLAENVVWSSADWDPQGKELVIVRARKPERSASNSRSEKCSSPREHLSARFSPDGREIAFWKRGGRQDEPRRGRPPRQAGEDPLLGLGQRVRRAVLERGRPRGLVHAARSALGAEALWAVSRSGKTRQLVKVPGTLELYDVAPGGRALLGHHTIIRSLRGLVSGESAERELAWLDSSLPADLSADGTTVLITEDGEGAGAGPDGLPPRHGRGAGRPASRRAKRSRFRETNSGF